MVDLASKYGFVEGKFTVKEIWLLTWVNQPQDLLRTTTHRHREERKNKTDKFKESCYNQKERNLEGYRKAEIVGLLTEVLRLLLDPSL